MGAAEPSLGISMFDSIVASPRTGSTKAAVVIVVGLGLVALFVHESVKAAKERDIERAIELSGLNNPSLYMPAGKAPLNVPKVALLKEGQGEVLAFPEMPSTLALTAGYTGELDLLINNDKRVQKTVAMDASSTITHEGHGHYRISVDRVLPSGTRLRAEDLSHAGSFHLDEEGIPVSVRLASQSDLANLTFRADLEKWLRFTMVPRPAEPLREGAEWTVKLRESIPGALYGTATLNAHYRISKATEESIEVDFEWKTVSDVGIQGQVEGTLQGRAVWIRTRGFEVSITAQSTARGELIEQGIPVGYSDTGKIAVRLSGATSGH